MEAVMSNPSKKEIGRTLQSLRKAAGFKSAAAFAKFVGMGIGRYTSYEQGDRAFNYEDAWIMADALHCTLDKLGGREIPRGYADSGQARLNRYYESLNDKSKGDLVEFAESWAKDTKRRIEKDGAEHADYQAAEGA